MLRALLAAASLAAVAPTPALAIQGGDVDRANTFSNVAILRFVDSDGAYPADRWRCTGTLVAPRVIITAAHCTEVPVDTVYYSFAPQGPLGEPDSDPNFPSTVTPNDPGWTFGATNADGSQSIYTDPRYDGKLQLQNLNDAGVIVLDQPVTGITPATIAPLDYLKGTKNGTVFTVAGYGIRFDKPGGAGPQKPTETADRERRWTTAPVSNITKDTIKLAVNPKDGRAGGGTCFGDSGGPILLNGYLVGVTSWGTSQFCTAGQAGYQRIDDADARAFYEPILAGA